MTQTNTKRKVIAAMKNVMEVTIAKIKNAHTLMWITIRVKWSSISNVKMGLNGKKHGHTKGVTGLIDTDKYEGHLTGDDDRQTQTWCWSKWMLKNAETKEQMDATSNLLNDAPLLLAEVKRLSEVLRDIHYDLTFKGTPEEMNRKALTTLSEVMYVD